ncbi:MAG: tRNA uridine(34) 5-carboxymethylaminomethyl modification radical SAM/GNAT enzyme Elp3 [Chloroflexi bacterium]|nr:tRNA uridine(34) 5-carboxymethylaminomethyl modification radical SAM/GNAT enzyme Elp3 [Chloroflexota bacterium]
MSTQDEFARPGETSTRRDGTAARDIEEYSGALIQLFADLSTPTSLSPTAISRLMSKRVPLPKDRIIEAYRQMTERGIVPFDRNVSDRLRIHPVRTISGVAPVAVLTGPYPCPADCIFCPEAKGFPKSYLPEEPGAQRAQMARFDPFRQTAMRLTALEQEGHTIQKIELLILGATWSAYPHKYQEWFIRRCLDAMNGADAATLAQAQAANETAEHRNVGLVIETRPDYIDMNEVRRLRTLGVTKVQMGAQSLDDAVLAANRRGHTVADTRRAVRLLRLAGFKLHLHWMPNLLGATPESDRADFARLWDDPALRPDELKIYPCTLIAGTELYKHWERGEYRPYTDEELLELLIACKSIVPPYCRINRVMRDIPAPYVAAGSIASHLRQIAQREMKRRGLQCHCIRCREVRNEKLQDEELHLGVTTYLTDATTEHFLSYVTPRGRLAGFLRLSLPSPHVPRAQVLEELWGSAVIREVHVYGPALELGTSSAGEAQHTGVGTRLIERAVGFAREAGFKRLAVISAIGTREYYRRHGFALGELYMSLPL